MDLSTIILLLVASVVAGIVDAAAGGGGLITIPAFLFAGVSPVGAIATNKLQGVIGVFAAILSYSRHSLINWKKGFWLIFISFIFGVLGAIAVNHISNASLSVIIPILLLATITYLVFFFKVDKAHPKQKIPFILFSLTVIPAVTFYDGFFGPGASSFAIMGFIILLGHDMLKANAYTKIADISCNIGALFIFMYQGNVLYFIGLLMAVGAFIGGSIGSRLAIAYGARIIKPILIFSSTIMAIKLLSDPTNPLMIFLHHHIF